MLVVFLLYLMINTALGMRVECLGTWDRASCPQYWSGSNLQIQDRKANFYGDLH
jgi:hypothetical protein